MSKEYALIIDTDNCVGCHACEVACKQEHNLPVGPRWLRVHSGSPTIVNGKPQFKFTVTHCMHCSRPPCRDACPVEAITRREDGAVLIDKALCIGCKKCIEACPLGVMQFDEEKEIAQKCDLCAERLDRGQTPACAAICAGHCIYFGTVDEVAEKLGRSRLTAWKQG